MVIDYTPALRSYYKGTMVEVISAQGKGTNFLMIIRKLKEGTTKSYEYNLVYRWLSSECLSPYDEAYVCVKGEEVQRYKAHELNKINRGILRGTANLFNCFDLF